MQRINIQHLRLVYAFGAHIILTVRDTFMNTFMVRPRDTFMAVLGTRSTDFEGHVTDMFMDTLGTCSNMTF